MYLVSLVWLHDRWYSRFKHILYVCRSYDLFLIGVFVRMQLQALAHPFDGD